MTASSPVLSRSLEETERVCLLTLGSLCLLGQRDPGEVFHRLQTLLEDVLLARVVLLHGLQEADELISAIAEGLRRTDRDALGGPLGQTLLGRGVCTSAQLIELLGERDIFLAHPLNQS